MALTVLTTTAAIFDVLGGNQQVQRLTGDQASTVSNWRTQRHFPAKHFVLINGALAPLGYEALPALFGMTKPGRRVKPPARMAAE
jgi:hypothetical protein